MLNEKTQSIQWTKQLTGALVHFGLTNPPTYPLVSHNPSSYPLPFLPSPIYHYEKVHAFCKVESHARFQAAKLVSCSSIDICYFL
jgi:hypothetical protein